MPPASVLRAFGATDPPQPLLRSGADPDTHNKAGRSPRQLAETIANYDLAQFFAHLQTP